EHLQPALFGEEAEQLAARVRRLGLGLRGDHPGTYIRSCALIQVSFQRVGAGYPSSSRLERCPCPPASIGGYELEGFFEGAARRAPRRERSPPQATPARAGASAAARPRRGRV